ncbi:MAG: hypothetical protein ABL888_02955 [Pirellulaceae bacterium]
MSTSEANTAFTRATSNVFSIPPGHRQRAIVSSAPQRSWRDGVNAQMTALIRLEVGWDGYFANPVTLENATFAFRMMEACCPDNAPEPHIAPGPNGDLQLEWHTTNVKIELHVREPNDVLAWHADAATGPNGTELSLTTDFTEVEKWILSLVRSGGAAATAAA